MKSCDFFKFLQHNYFTKFLEIKDHKKYLDIRFLIPDRLVMDWQTKYNDIDCGIFTMHHMETYMGGGSDSWTTKIMQESVSINLTLLHINFLYM